jgi:hypothetical protein
MFESVYGKPLCGFGIEIAFLGENHQEPRCNPSHAQSSRMPEVWNAHLMEPGLHSGGITPDALRFR